MAAAALKKMYKDKNPRVSSSGCSIRTLKTILTTSEDETSHNKSKTSSTLQSSIKELETLAARIRQEHRSKLKNNRYQKTTSTNSVLEKNGLTSS